MATAAACALLLAGCSLRLDDPTLNHQMTPEGAIGFRAGSALLLDDAQTKGGDIKDGTLFSIDDAFCVFGRRYGAASQTLIFDGTTVTKELSGWTYSPAKFWYWESAGNYYDFLAIYPAGKGTTRMDIEGNLAAQTSYDLERTPTPDNYDLMAATYRRQGSVSDPTAPVDFNFNHMTSAVGVVIINQSTDTDVSISQIEFQNLVVCGTAKVTINNLGGSLLSWINTERNTHNVRVTTYTPEVNVEAGKRFALDNDHPEVARGYDLMIPQRLDQAATINATDVPKLLLTYTPEGGVSKTHTITLKDVLRADSTPLTSWEMGRKYTYFISMRLDGGLLVSITTTAWEDIEAETPGILIP